MDRFSRPQSKAATAIMPPPIPDVPPLVQGYVDEITATAVSGWVRDHNHPSTRIALDVLVERGDGAHVIATGIGDQPYPPLFNDGVGDGRHGFTIPLPPLTYQERRDLIVQPRDGANPLERAWPYQGYVDERSVNHVAGWIRNRFDPVARIAFEVAIVTAEQDTVIATGTAENFYTMLAARSEDAFHGFQLLFKTPLTEAERDAVVVRAAGQNSALPLSPRLVTNFELLSFVAMDIVNNCNLRCPFCLFDYSGTRATKFMSEATFDAALRLLPHVGEANFWLSCLHEPSLHPDFLRLIDRIPRQWRQKVMFTTNLAKRMPDSYYQALADSGVFHINLSIESTTPAIYEKFRKGARWPIFKENWDRLITAWRAAAAPPRLRYITMAYKSNLAEIPALVKFLRADRLAWQVEIRATYEMTHILTEFAAAEYLADHDWDWLAEQLAEYPSTEVLLTRPLPAGTPAASVPAEIADLDDSDVKPQTPAATIPDPVETVAEPPPVVIPARNKVAMPLNMQVEWDGEIVICGKWELPSERRCLTINNINLVAEPYEYLVELSNATVPPLIQGYVDAISATEISGWIRDGHDPAYRVGFEVAIPCDDGVRVIAAGIADQATPSLHKTDLDDGLHGFHVALPAPLAEDERRQLIVRDDTTHTVLARAPALQGFVDELRARRVAGWVRDRFDPDRRVAVEILLNTAAGAELLWQGFADQSRRDLVALSIGDGRYGFRAILPRPLSDAEQAAIIVRPVGTATPLDVDLGQGPLIQGYVDFISATNITGWMRESRFAGQHSAFEVVLELPRETEILARGVADQIYPALGDSPHDDNAHGFDITLPGPLTAHERHHLVIRAADTGEILPRAPRYQGFVDTLTERRAAGWVRDRFDPEHRVDVEVLLPAAAGAELLWQGVADAYDPALASAGVGDARYGFRASFGRRLSESEQRAVIVRPAGSAANLDRSPRLTTAEPALQ
jgi:hypothetical protein